MERHEFHSQMLTLKHVDLATIPKAIKMLTFQDLPKYKDWTEEGKV